MLTVNIHLKLINEPAIQKFIIKILHYLKSPAMSSAGKVKNKEDINIRNQRIRSLNL